MGKLQEPLINGCYDALSVQYNFFSLSIIFNFSALSLIFASSVSLFAATT
jgi:hypothetical protein